MSISAAALSLSNPLPARPAAPARAEDRAAQERAFALPPEPLRDEAAPRAPIKIGKSATQASARETPEAGRNDTAPSTDKRQDQRPAESASPSDGVTGTADAVTVEEKPGKDADPAAPTEPAAQAAEAPVELPVVPPVAVVAAIILPVEDADVSAPNAAAPQAGDAVVAAPATSVPDQGVVAPLRSGLPAPDAASESLSQHPATAAGAQPALKGQARHEKTADGLTAELIAGDNGASEPAQRAEQPQQAQATQTAALRPADGSQLGILLSNLQAEASPAAPPAPHIQPPRPDAAEAHVARAIPPGAVPIEIGLRALQGAREFQIRLDPAELGRVEVRLEIGDDKSVSAKVVVDRVETLHLLQRESKTLERAFEQAGLKSSDSGIDITLRDHGQQSNQQRSEAFTDEIGGRARKAAAGPVVLPSEIPIRRSLHVGALDRSI